MTFDGVSVGGMEESEKRRSGADTTPGALATGVFVTALALWVGSAAFYSGVVLPVLFINLAATEAGAIAALVFPWYFRVGCVLGVIVTAAAWRLARGAGRWWQLATAVLAAMTASQLYSTLVVFPEVALLRGNRDQLERFAALHQLSVHLNAVVLVGGILILCGSGLLLSRRERPA